MQPQLYMWSGARAIFQERHRFYADQIRRRVLTQFHNIEDEAEAFANSEYERLGNMPCGEDGGDMEAIAEHAHEASLNYYMLLDDLRKQTTLGALAGMYHQWEKDLREFIERELVHSLPHSKAKELAWKSANIDKIFGLLEDFGWPIREQTWFAKLDAYRLVVNVYKHGKGASLDTLAGQYPEYLKSPLDELVPNDQLDPDYEYLAVTDEQFKEFDEAIEAFWSEFPERLYYTSKK